MRDKILAAVRFLLAVAIMAILIGQLYGLVREAGWYYGNWVEDKPSGNSIKVFRQEQPPPALEEDSRVIKWLKEYYSRD